MTDRRTRHLILPATALMLAGAALAGCERRPYPEPSMAEAPAQPAAPDLMGAPEDRNGNVAPPSDSAEHESEQAQGMSPDGGPYPPPPPEASSEAAPPVPAAPPLVIAMAPIPNPPEDEGRRHDHWRSYERREVRESTPFEGRAAVRAQHTHHHHHHHRGRHLERAHASLGGLGHKHPADRHARPGHARPGHAPTGLHAGHERSHESTQTGHGAHVPSAHPAPSGAAARTDHHHQPAAPGASARPIHVVPIKPAPVIKPPAHLILPTGPSLRAPAAPDRGPPAHKKHHRPDVTADTPSAAPSADQAAKLSALAGALSPVIASRAALHGADRLKADAPGDVTLTIPPDFADGLRNEAQRSGLADEAASSMVTARLLGDGYAVTPADPQSQPLTSGKTTEFRWTVTRMDEARSPLRAEVGADLLGGGKQHLDLGVVSASAPGRFRISPRAVGAGLLFLIVLLIGLVMAGGRRVREPSGAVAPRRNHITDGAPPPEPRT